jgi:hypothetical protein
VFDLSPEALERLLDLDSLEFVRKFWKRLERFS